MKNPKLTIIVPTYNHQDYISDALDSILSQTVKPHEVIIINDGSLDHTLEIAQNYPFKVISQVNKGLPSARNTGIMNATGDYILPFDSDDVMLENCIERIMQAIEETDSDIVSPSFKTFGTSNEKVILMPNPTLEDFKVANRIGYCSAIKKEALLEVGGYSPKMVWGWEDFDLWFDLLKRQKKIITIPEILWLYRTKEESMITESNRHADELWAQIKKNHPQIW